MQKQSKQSDGNAVRYFEKLGLKGLFHLKRLKNIEIDDLAAISGMKPEYFRHSFSKAFGVPPLKYINRLKLERAKLLLSEGRSVNDTAAAVGFVSANYFTRFFRERTGLTPTEFVKRGLC